MAKEFNIHTYPTFFSLLLIMLIPFALSVDDIMNNHQSNMKIILLISVFIIIILIYGLVKTRKRKIVINELGLLITEKEGNMKISWEEISHIFFCSTPFWGLYSHPLKTIFQHKACTDKLYADSFYKVQKNSYSSFEVICCRG